MDLYTYYTKRKYRVAGAVMTGIFFIALVFQVGWDGLGLGWQLFSAIGGVLTVFCIWNCSSGVCFSPEQKAVRESHTLNVFLLLIWGGFLLFCILLWILQDFGGK